MIHWNKLSEVTPSTTDKVLVFNPREDGRGRMCCATFINPHWLTDWHMNSELHITHWAEIAEPET